MLNSIKTLKKYCKANLNVFLVKKILMMTKKISITYNRIFVSNQNLTTEHIISMYNIVLKQKIYYIHKIFSQHKNIFLLKNTFKVT